ncbi:L,D-transpeptidase family protein [Actinoplanes sp. NPDC049265]|uniref:L,D-transpeptidase family protein n=1 Tax=Actinoplanes sp. NPDC049265 TaxID=3363902 RepID=UPI00371D5BA2
MGVQRTIGRIGAIAAAIAIGAGVLVAGSPAASAAAASCSTGKYQKQVEGYLKKLGYKGISVDGRQSKSDCAAIKKFQGRYGIRPASGLAGPTTNAVAKRITGTRVSSCKASRSKTTVCVDLTHQTIFVMKGGKVIYGPTVTRTGMKGHRTPTGTYKIGQRATREYSEKYKVWMPYWQRFNGGIGLHQTTTYLHDTWRGSHGCVNLLPSDAKWMWSHVKKGNTVKVYGRRPGT